MVVFLSICMCGYITIRQIRKLDGKVVWWVSVHHKVAITFRKLVVVLSVLHIVSQVGYILGASNTGTHSTLECETGILDWKTEFYGFPSQCQPSTYW